MKETINRKVYDTDNAKMLGCKYVGEFGQSDGYEERLLVTKAGHHFIYGVGGAESKYIKPTIKPLTDKQAEEWKKENPAAV